VRTRPVSCPRGIKKKNANCNRTFGENPADLPLLVPIMIGNTAKSTEEELGHLLSPYLKDESNAFVISSDFAHWGLRFSYTYYQPSSESPTNLTSSAKSPKSPAIHESIEAVDLASMGACESGSHASWLKCLSDTGNTVCGRHPIGVMMAAVEDLRRKEGKGDVGAFKFFSYARSSLVRTVKDSSVSYASAFAVV
jgi:MEMO1 family protein